MVLTSEQRECYERVIADDMVMITGDLDEDNLHDLLSSRFRNGDIYTFIGNVLISVNPYKKIEKKGKLIYSEDVARYYSKSDSAQLSPHIFSIASDAYTHLKNYERNQTIVVTGESGSGKTEAAKSLMSFLTFQSSQEVAEQHFHISDGEVNTQVLSQGNEQAHSLSNAHGQHIAGTAGLTKFEVADMERRMQPEEKLERALRLMAEREAKLEKKKGLGKGGVAGGDDDKMLSYFNSKSRSTSAAGEKTVPASVFLRLPHLKDLQRDGVVKEDFLQVVCAHLQEEVDREQGDGEEGGQWPFAVFMRGLQLAEIEVMHTDPLRKKSRKFSNFQYDDQFVVKMEYETNPLKLNALNELKSQLLESNPVLEMFGNSKTLRNDNSSRFGKYLELQFDGGYSLVGGKLTTFLLEKARLVHQVPGERNFHVMHLLIEGTSQEEKDKYMLEPPEQYFYLQNEHSGSPADASAKQLQMLQASLLKVGIARHRVEDIFYLLSGILSIGNLTFEEPSGCDEDVESVEKGPLKVVDEDELDKCAALLCVDASELEAALVKHKFYQGHDSSYQASEGTSRPRKNTMATSHHTHDGACSIRDSLAKEIYNRLFVWIVHTINENIDYAKVKKKTMGILDIYGFEIFEMNGFEQLCINWCNEKLQAFFIDQTIRAEQTEYDNEGIPWTPIDYFDNAVVLSLIEQKPGIISLLEDQNVALSTDADKFTQSLEITLQANKYFITPQMSMIKTGTHQLMFGVKHYAGVVYYSTEHFGEKNNDILVNDLMKLMINSKNTFVSKLFEDRRTEAEKLKKPPKLGTQFRKDLASLVDTLAQCKSHYVRCIKPNEDKSPRGLDKDKVIHQIKYLGLIENIKVRRAGYCYRENFSSFVQRFGMISALTWGSAAFAATSRVSDSDRVIRLLTGGQPTVWKHTPALVTQRLVENTDFRMGLTKVFIKEPRVLFQLERDRRLAVNALVTRVQALVRGAARLREYRQVRRGFVLSQANIRCFLGVKHYRKTLVDMIRLQSLLRKFIERCRYRKMFAQFRGQPPRLYAQLLQKHVRGLLAKSLLQRTDPEKFAAVQRNLENIRTFVARTAAQIKIAARARAHKKRKDFVVMRAAQTIISAHARGRRRRKVFFNQKIAANRIRFSFLVKLRWLRKERRINKALADAVAAWRAPEGMRVFKCRANGTKAVQKVFRLVKDTDNVLIWNAGLMSKMRAGVPLHQETMILQGGHTFKNDDVERTTMPLNIQNNPFKLNDARLKKEAQAQRVQAGEEQEEEESEGRESEFHREEMVQRAVTIANPGPPLQELVLVLDSPAERDSLFAALRRLASKFPAPTK